MITKKILEVIAKEDIKKAILIYITEENKVGWCCSYLEDDEVRKLMLDLESKMKEIELNEISRNSRKK